jgi:SHAQKYF class myb-like DNA-binding protein
MKSNQKRKASPLPSPVAYPMMTSKPPPPSPSMAPFPPSDGVKSVPTPPDLSSGTQVGRWTKREHELFLEGLQRFGKSWKKISSLVHTRTLVQIRTHAQKYLQKQSRAAIKADAKAAEAAMSREPPTRLKAPQQQSKTATAGQLTVQMNAPRVPTMPPRPWKSPRPGDRSSFAPVAFPSSLSTSASMPRTSSRSAAQLNSINRLDQLLQDDSSAIPAFVDEYYTSPTAIEDDLLRPLYTGEQWVPPSATYSNKRRRVETSSLPACSSAPTSSSTAGPVLRPAFPGATFKPLPAPESLSPPGNSPEAHPQRQPAAAAALLAAHETDESTSYTNAWL